MKRHGKKTDENIYAKLRWKREKDKIEAKHGEFKERDKHDRYKEQLIIKKIAISARTGQTVAAGDSNACRAGLEVGNERRVDV